MTVKLRSERVVTPTGVRPADVVIRDGRIVDVTPPEGAADHDFGPLAIVPGAVDVHVHINEPGRTEWEGFQTATRAAAAGGSTTLVDMPLNSIPSTTTYAALQKKLAACAGKLHVDVGFWGGLVPGNAGNLRALWDGGVLGFKCFMVDSGVAEFEAVDARDLEEAMPILAELDAPLLAHAELAASLNDEAWEKSSPLSHKTWVASRPDSAEYAAIELLAEIAKRHRARAHVVHLASAEALPLVRELRASQPGFTVETCAHYLTFAAEEIPEGATAYKCAPPIRGADTREALWSALGDGLIDFVTTDHSPSPPDLKAFGSGRFDRAWGGIPSIQLLWPAVWTGAAERGFELSDVARWVATAPATFAGIAARKGAISAGRDADLVVFDPDATFVVRREEMAHRHRYTPYEGMELRGVVEATYLRGVKVFERGGGWSAPSGSPLLREIS